MRSRPEHSQTTFGSHRVPPSRARLVLAVVGIVLLTIVAVAALSVVIFAS